MVDGGALTVANCIFTGNETAIGGGAFINGSGAPVFTDCLFDANSATESAGLLLHGECDPIVRNCTFRRCGLTMVGGGVTWSGLGQALFEGAPSNNAVFETGGILEAFRTTIRDNVAPEGADGVVGGSASATFTCCDVDPGSWSIFGTWTVDNEGCGEGVEPMDWGRLKAMFR